MAFCLRLNARTQSPKDSFSVLLLDEGVFSDRVLACLWTGGVRRVHVLSTKRRSLSRHSRLVRSFDAVPDIFSGAEGLERVVREIRRHQPDVVLPVDFTAMMWCARHRAVPELQGRLPPELLASLHDKTSLHEHLLAAGQPVIPQANLLPHENPIGKTAALRFPVMMKPACGRGGHYNVLVADAAALRSKSREEPFCSAPCVVQEYVPGDDRDINVLCDSGAILASCVQEGLGPKYSRHGSDRMVRLLADADLTSHAAAIVRATGFSGVAHLDYRRCRRTGKLFLVDFNPRFWTSLLASLAVGMNFPHLMCLRALGKPLPSQTPREGIFLTDYLPPRELAAHLVGIGGKRVPLDMTSWRWQMSDPMLQARRFLRALKSRVFGHTNES
jgi:biotin carboxylase